MKGMKSSHKRYRLFILACCTATLLLTTSGNMGRRPPVASAQQDKTQQQAISLAKRRGKMEKWKASFLTHSIPFSPESLASENWREELVQRFVVMAGHLDRVAEVDKAVMAAREVKEVKEVTAVILP